MLVYRMLTALERLRSAAPSHGLGQVLLGQRPPSPPQEISDLQFFDESLNESQKDAVRFALGAHEIALVHGPPGVIPIASITNNIELNAQIDCRQARHIHWSKLSGNSQWYKTKKCSCVVHPIYP